MNKDYLEELAEQFDTSKSAITKYYNLLMEKLEKMDIDLQYDKDRIEYALEHIVSERSSINNHVDIVEADAYSLDESVERAIQNTFGTGYIDPSNDYTLEEGIRGAVEKADAQVIRKF